MAQAPERAGDRGRWMKQQAPGKAAEWHIGRNGRGI
jgi:hypothetical protein